MFTKNGFSASDFLNAATELHDLEVKTGKSFDALVEEFKKTKDQLSRVNTEVGSLETKREELTKQTVSLSSQLGTLGATKKKLESEVDALSTRSSALESVVDKAKDEHSQLKKEIREFSSRKTKLAAEVDSKEASLARINDIGLSDEDLIRLKKSLETISQSGTIGQEQVRERFFAVLATFKDICELGKCQEQEKAAVDHLTRKKALLTGQIAALEQTRNLLEGQITETVSSAVGKIMDAADKAAQELRQQADRIGQSFDGLVKQAAEVGVAVGEMKTAVRKGEESQKNLSDFVRDVRFKVVKTDG